MERQVSWRRFGRSISNAAAAAVESGNVSTDSNPERIGAWKWAVRKRVWDLLESEGVHASPRHRFPTFNGVEAAAQRVGRLAAFRAADCVSVNTDAPQRPVRLITLKEMKKLLIPCLTTTLFSMLDPIGMSESEIKDASNKADSRDLGEPVSLDSELKVDLLVLGSVAVDPNTGARLGKGEGLADLEYAVLRYMKAIDDSTLVVTTVHDKQLVDDLPAEKMLNYDVPVDIICTPTQTIHTNTTSPKPSEIYWDSISSEMVSQRKFLNEIRRKIKEETGQTVKLAPSPQRAPRLSKNDATGPAVFISELNPGTTEAELTDHLKQLGLSGGEVTIFRTASWKPVARVSGFTGDTSLEKVVRVVDNTELNGWRIKAKRDADTQGGGKV